MAVFQNSLDIDPDSVPPNARWNFWAIALDASIWNVGVAMMNQSSVLPFFLKGLGADDFHIGLMGAVAQAGWLFPQLLASSVLAHRPRKLPFLFWSCIAGRLPFLLLAIVLWFATDAWYLSVILLFYTVFAGFWVSDALASVPWLDIIGKGIPTRKRGRLFGTIGLLGGLGSAITGLFLVDRILEHPALPFPKNYSVLFFGVFVTMLFSAAWVLMIREPPGVVEEKARPIHKLVRDIPALLRKQPEFTRMLVVQFFLNAWTMAYPFIALAATNEYGTAIAISGAFVFAERFGATGMAFFWGHLNDHMGSRIVIRGTSLTLCLALVLTLFVPSINGFLYSGGAAVPWEPIMAFAVVMFLLGSAQTGIWGGLTNYMMEVVPDAERTTYIGLKNTLGGVAVIWPLIGGWIARAWSYDTVFTIAAIGMGIGLLLTYWLPEPRHMSVVVHDITHS